MWRRFLPLVLALSTGCLLDWSAEGEAGGTGNDASTSGDGQAMDEDAGPASDGAVPTGFTVESVSPADGVPLEDVLGVVTVTFSADVAAETVDEASLRVLRGGTPIAGERTVAGRTSTFQPTTPWVLGASYTVELAASIHDAEGTALEAAAFPFQVREGAWQASRLDDAYGDLDLTVAPAGRAAVTWVKNGANGTEIWASYAEPGSTFIPPNAISSASGSFIHARPQIRLRDDGPIVAVWYSFDTTKTASFDGATFSPMTNVYNPGSSYQPDVVLGRSLAYVAMDSSADVRGLVVTSFTPGQDGGTLTTVAANIPYDESSFQSRIALIGNDPIVLWDQGVGGRTTIYAHYLDQSQGENDTVSAPEAAASEVRIGVDPLGSSAIAVWQQIDPAWTNVWAARTVPGGSFAEPVKLSDDQGAATLPSVALDERGRGLAVWQQASGAASTIMAARFEPTSGWSAAEPVSEGAGGKATQPVVVMERGGNALIVWTEADASDAALVDLWVARYAAGEGFRSAQRKVLSSTRTVSLGADGEGTNPAPGRPALGVDELGRAFAGWREDGGIWIARFE